MDSGALHESDGDSVCESDNGECSESSRPSMDLLQNWGDGESRDDQIFLNFPWPARTKRFQRFWGKIAF
jgi:hypothetical protein